MSLVLDNFQYGRKLLEFIDYQRVQLQVILTAEKHFMEAIKEGFPTFYSILSQAK